MAATSETERWVRGHLVTRGAAAVWWVAMVLFPVCIVENLIIWLTHEPTVVGGLIWAVVAVALGIPLVREAPHARRMGRMLVHGT